jgi:hypothetical protein
MDRNFKVGDRVKCVDASVYLSGSGQVNLVNGYYYTIAGVRWSWATSSWFCSWVGGENVNVIASRFELAALSPLQQMALDISKE